MSTDLEFSQRCANGDRQAWDEFLVKYSRLIYSYIFSAARTAGKQLSPSEHEDIFQDIVLSLIDNDSRKLRSYRALNGCTLASWLRQVTVNFTINYLVKTGAAVSLEAENYQGLSLKELIPDYGRLVSDTSSEKEHIGRLGECIDRLETDDRYFIELNLNQGLNLEEIRGHLKITRGAADMRKARIVERLRDCFKGKGVIV